MKLPFLQLFPSDYMRDTRALSLAAKGGWMDILCMLHGSSTRGTMRLPVVGWARVMGATVDQSEAVIAELESMRVADVVREGNGDVTISSRRMLREAITREQTRLRVARHRCNAECNGDGNAPVTGQKSETRSQKPETRKQTGGGKKQEDVEPTVIPLLLSTDEFAAAWKDWRQHRREIKKPITPLAEREALKKLEAMGVDRAIAAIRHSIASQWQGIFEPNDRPGRSQRKGEFDDRW